MKTKFIKYNNLFKIMYLGELLFLHDGIMNVRNTIVQKIYGENIKILDMCTGIGENVINISKLKKSAEITAIDISPKAIQILQKRILRKKIQNVHIKKMDAGRTNFEDGEFNYVLISLVLHELESKYIDRILNESKRLIRDKGELIVTEWKKPSSFFKKLKFQFLYLIEPSDFKKFLKMDLKKYLEDRDLRVKEVISSNYTITYFCETNIDNNI